MNIYAVLNEGIINDVYASNEKYCDSDFLLEEVEDESKIMEVKNSYKIRNEFNQFTKKVIDNYIQEIPSNELLPTVEFIEYKKTLLKEQINAIKIQLTESDYKVFKYIDGEIAQSDYDLIKEQRKSWRRQINQIEKEITKL